MPAWLPHVQLYHLCLPAAGFILTASDANMGADAGTFELDVYGPKAGQLWDISAVCHRCCAVWWLHLPCRSLLEVGPLS